MSCKELRSILTQLTYVVSEGRIDRNDAAGRELTKPQQKLVRDPGKAYRRFTGGQSE